MVDDKLIEKLLTAFYNGDTTREEEAILREFFNTKEISEKWNVDRTLFYALYDSSEIDVPKGFSERLENNIDKFNVSKENKRIRHLFTGAGSIAAAILLLAGIFFFHNRPLSDSNMMTDTYTDPQEAAIVAEKIITLVSVNLNKGFSPLEKVKENIDKTNEILNENFKLNN
ncbi:MAG: hypothetical protein LBL33_01475 [Tannerella sp.]|jgi:hypothetical protein|nr:hypothetical protein [Tannerella sp.]